MDTNARFRVSGSPTLQRNFALLAFPSKSPSVSWACSVIQASTPDKSARRWSGGSTNDKGRADPEAPVQIRTSPFPPQGGGEFVEITIDHKRGPYHTISDAVDVTCDPEQGIVSVYRPNRCEDAELGETKVQRFGNVRGFSVKFASDK